MYPHRFDFKIASLLTTANMGWTIKYGQAHTRGDGVAYLPAEGIVFVGDLAVNYSSGNNLSDQDVSYVGVPRTRQYCQSSIKTEWFRPTEILVMLICCIASGTSSPTCGNRSSRVSKPESLRPN